MYRMTLASMLLLGGCMPQDNELWIEPGSTADSLVWGVGKHRGGAPVDQFHVLRVSRCDGPHIGEGAMWVLSLSDDVPALERVHYGETPVGYTSDQGPLPLDPGCYQASATTGGLVEFHVLEDRSIREVEPQIRWRE